MSDQKRHVFHAGVQGDYSTCSNCGVRKIDSNDEVCRGSPGRERIKKRKQTDFSTYLTPARTERLACLAEEAGEVVQAVGKILRHGYDSYHPNQNTGRDNRHDLRKEINDVLAAVRALEVCSDIPEELSPATTAQKILIKKSQYFHFQEDEPAMRAFLEQHK